jgi:hypothetical protein
LFTAQWLLHAAPRTAGEDVAGWRVDDAASLALWERAQRRATGDAQGPRTFLPGLLADEHAAVFSLGTKPQDINAGVIAYRAAGMVGLTNLFTPRGEHANRYAGAVQMAARTFPGLPIVSYAHGDELRAALDAGCACIGPLHVWTRDAR